MPSIEGSNKLASLSSHDKYFLVIKVLIKELGMLSCVYKPSTQEGGGFDKLVQGQPGLLIKFHASKTMEREGE